MLQHLLPYQLGLKRHRRQHWQLRLPGLSIFASTRLTAASTTCRSPTTQPCGVRVHALQKSQESSATTSNGSSTELNETSTQLTLSPMSSTKELPSCTTRARSVGRSLSSRHPRAHRRLYLLARREVRRPNDVKTAMAHACQLTATTVLSCWSFLLKLGG